MGNRRPNPPFRQHERVSELSNTLKRVSELSNTLKVWGVSCDQLEAVRQGNGRDHGIGKADGLTRTFQFAADDAGQLGGGLVERDHFLGRNRGEEGLELSRSLL